MQNFKHIILTSFDSFWMKAFEDEVPNTQKMSIFNQQKLKFNYNNTKIDVTLCQMAIAFRLSNDTIQM